MTDEEIIRANLMSDNAARALDRLTAEMARKDAALREAEKAMKSLAFRAELIENDPWKYASVSAPELHAVADAIPTIRAALGESEKPENEKAPDRP